jgi:hypothetical protein
MRPGVDQAGELGEFDFIMSDAAQGAVLDVAE